MSEQQDVNVFEMPAYLALKAENEMLREERDKNGYMALAAQAENERLLEDVANREAHHDNHHAENERLREQLDMALTHRGKDHAELARLREAIRNDCQHEYGGIPAWMEETRAALKETND